MTVQAVYRPLVLALIVAILVYFRQYIIASLLPFFIAFVLAGVIEPAVRLLEKHLRVPRSTAVIGVLSAVLVIGGYATTLIAAKILSEMVDMAGQANVYQRMILDISRDLLDRLQQVDDELIPAPVHQALLDTVEGLARTGRDLISASINHVLGAFAALPSLMIVTIITVLSTFFIAKERSSISGNLLRLAPKRWREPLGGAQERIVVDMGGFLKAQLVLFAITTSVAALGLFWMGTRYWLSLAIVAGILDLIPIVGPGFLLFPWAAISLFLGETAAAIQLVVIFLAMFIARQLLQAKILGDSIGIHPLLMLVSLYAGIVSFGVQGFIIGPVLVIIGRALWNAGLFPPRSEVDEQSKPTGGDDGVPAASTEPEGHT